MATEDDSACLHRRVTVSRSCWSDVPGTAGASDLETVDTSQDAVDHRHLPTGHRVGPSDSLSVTEIRIFERGVTAASAVRSGHPELEDRPPGTACPQRGLGDRQRFCASRQAAERTDVHQEGVGQRATRNRSGAADNPGCARRGGNAGRHQLLSILFGAALGLRVRCRDVERHRDCLAGAKPPAGGTVAVGCGGAARATTTRRRGSCGSTRARCGRTVLTAACGWDRNGHAATALRGAAAAGGRRAGRGRCLAGR